MSIGTQPEGFIRGESGGKHGKVVYDRPLTKEEIYKYELNPVEYREPKAALPSAETVTEPPVSEAVPASTLPAPLSQTDAATVGVTDEAKSGESLNNQALIEEARKYKTVDEFVQKTHSKFFANADKLTPEEKELADAFYKSDKEAVWNKAHKAQLKSTTAGSKRQGKVGDMLSSGEVVLTSSGHETSPFPKITTGTNRKMNVALKRVDSWLRENAIAEAKSRGDEWNARQFESENPKNIPQASKDSMENYLFGQQPKVVPSILKDLTTPKEATHEKKTDLS